MPEEMDRPQSRYLPDQWSRPQRWTNLDSPTSPSVTY